MEFSRNWPKIGLLLVYPVVAVVLFLSGVVFGRFALGSPVPPTPGVIFVTLTSIPAVAGQAAATPGATPCVPAGPVGWAPYTIQPGDTLSGLAARFNVSQGRILKANCLISPDDLQAGQSLFLPPLLTPTPCTPSLPVGWSLYTVQSGDTLSSLAAARGVTTGEVIRVNCLTSTDLVQDQPLFLPALPTPTPCALSPPVGWDLYTVQSGDTLFSLAATRGTTTAEVLRVNCLLLTDIGIGDTLYLPALPTPTPTPPPSATSPAVAFTPAAQIPQALPPAPGVAPPVPAPPVSAFRRRGDLSPLSLKAAKPASEVRSACRVKPPNFNPDEPWIDHSDFLDNDTVETGMRINFYACNFFYGPTPSAEAFKLTSWISGVGVEKKIDVQFHIPPYQNSGSRRSQGIAVWSPTCDLDEGAYTVTIANGEDKEAEVLFNLKRATEERMLIVPQAAPVGTTFQAYFCGYEANTTIKVDLYYQAALNLITTTLPITTPPPSPAYEKHTYAHVDSWDVPINVDGWGRLILPSSPGDLDVNYSLREQNAARNETFTLFR